MAIEGSVSLEFSRIGTARSDQSGGDQKMRVRNGHLWVAASLLTVALAGCCDKDHPFGVSELSGRGPAAVTLGATSTFTVLAGTTVTNTATPTVVTGDLGVSPGYAVTNFPPGTVVSGTIHTNDGADGHGRQPPAIQLSPESFRAQQSAPDLPVSQERRGCMALAGHEHAPLVAAAVGAPQPSVHRHRWGGLLPAGQQLRLAAR